MEESGFCAAADGETSDCAEGYFAAAQFVNRCLPGRKVSRASVTEGARGTERRQKAAVLPAGGFQIKFFVSNLRKRPATNFRQKAKEKGERESRALLQSPSAPAPSRREPMTVRVFSLCQRVNFCKNLENIKDKFPKFYKVNSCGFFGI